MCSEFGPEIGPIVVLRQRTCHPHRSRAARLNAMLRFPRQAMTGWHLVDAAGRLRGLAVLNVIPSDQGRTRTGKIVDCLLDDIDVEHWQAAMLALTDELRQGLTGAGVCKHAMEVEAFAKAVTNRGSR